MKQFLNRVSVATVLAICLCASGIFWFKRREAHHRRMELVRLDVLQDSYGSTCALIAERCGETSMETLARGNSNYVYRLTWMSYLRGDGFINVRILADGTGELRWQVDRLSSRTNTHGQAKLPAAAVQGFVRLVTAERFWFLESSYEDKFIDEHGNELILEDGAEWIVEGVRADRYHVVGRLSPPSNDPINRIARRMLELAGVEPKGL